MAQPMEDKVPPFCLLVFGTDNKYSSKDVSHRWKCIIDELHKLKIQVLTVSSDSDPRYNHAMRQMSLLGCDSDLLANSEWFSCGNNGETLGYGQFHMNG